MARMVFLSGAMLGVAIGILGTLAQKAYQVKADYGTCLQTYPNIQGRLLLENDFVVVQRFSFPPGQWEGVHAHSDKQLFIHLTDAHWKVRFGETVETSQWSAGSVGWFGPVNLSDDHESVNMGQDPIDLIWVTLKDGCAATS